MRLFAYRYRPIHAITEKLLSIVARFVSQPKDLPLNEPPKKVLVLKFGGMGEAVLARSLLASLSERNPSMSIDYLVEERTAEIMACGSEGRILKYAPDGDGIGKALKLLNEVRHRKYDAILDFEQQSLLTSVFAKASSIPIRVGFAPTVPNTRDRMFTHVVELREQESMWSAFVRLGRVVDQGLPESQDIVSLQCSAESNAWLDGWWREREIPTVKSRVVAMHLGVGPSAQYRRWPIERFAALANLLAGVGEDLTIVLTGAKAERPLMMEFRRRFVGRCVDAFDLGGIEHTASLLRRCDLMISGDTGIMHLAAAMGTPTIGLFGPNTPVCWAPVGPRATYVYSTRLPCSPCINSYRRHIPEKCIAALESACMWDIAIDDVLNAARKVVYDSWLG